MGKAFSYYPPKKAKGIYELYTHTKRRLLERYNIDITEQDYKKISKTIRRYGKHPPEGTLSYIGRSSHNRTVWDIDIYGYKFIGVYDKKRHLLVTALPNSKESLLGITTPKEKK